MKKLNLQTWVIIGLVGLLLVSGWFNFISTPDYVESIRLDAERDKRDSQKAINRFQKEAETEREARKAIEAISLALAEASRKSDSTTIIWKKRYLNEKRKSWAGFSDATYDSLLSGLYPN